MIGNIIKYEIKHRFTHWSIFLLFGLLIFQGIWNTKGFYDTYLNEDLLMNASSIFYKNLAGCGVLLVIVIAVITGPILYKELQHKTGQWLFTSPVNEKRFFIGRFLAAFAINVMIAFGYVVGMILVPYVGIGEAHQFGPTPIGQLFHGFFLLLVPNVFLLTSLVFFALTFTKKIAVSYIAVFIPVIAFLVMETTATNSGATSFLLLAEPFGYVAIGHTIDFLSVAEKNFGYFQFTDYLLVNRLMWLMLGGVLLFLSYRKFSFKGFLKTNTKRKGKPIEDAFQIESTGFQTEINKSRTSFTQFTFIKKLFFLSAIEIKKVVRASSFKIIVGVVIFMILLQNLLWNASYYIGPTEPLTFTMTNFRLSFGVFVMILLMVWSGELFFKDRTAKFWQIADALPVPTWTVAFSRFLAMMVVALFLAVAFILAGIFVQIIKGGVSLIDMQLYIYDLLGYNWGWLTYVLQIATVFLIAGITKKRIATHIISVGIFFFTLLTFELGLVEQLIYGYSYVPGLEDYSEMNGYGMWVKGAKQYFLMWLLLATCFILVGIWYWQRGSDRKWQLTIIPSKQQLSVTGKVALVLFFSGFLLIRMKVIDEVNGKSNFVLSKVNETHKANYEKKYARLKTIPQPKYQEIDLKLDFFPEHRRAHYKAKVRLSNLGRMPIDTLYLNWEDFVTPQNVSINGSALEIGWNDEVSRITAYPIPQTYKYDSIMVLNIQAMKKYSGFTQSGSDAQPDLMFNGSFGSIREFLPTIGYQYGHEILENRKRLEYGLTRLDSRMADVTDSLALNQDAFAVDANWVMGTIELSTKEGQVAIAPGSFIKKWSESGRTHHLFQTDGPLPFQWYIGSADYEIESFEARHIKVEILYDPKHDFNIALYKDAVTKAVSFVQQTLGGFPTVQLRIYEIPPYQDLFYSFQNAIAISEKEGWYAKMEDMPEKAYLYQIVASQIIKQWLYSHVKIANVQGADILKIALPEALALSFVEKTLGSEARDILIQKKSGQYAKDKNSETNSEPSLLYADGADYLELNKGAVVLHQAIQEYGQKGFINDLQKFIGKNADRYISFLGIYDWMKYKLSDETRSGFEN